MTKPLHESTTLVEATTSTDSDSGVLEVEFITAGWGSSGYYSKDVVEAAAPLFEVGTHMYFDHPSASEASDRPERSVRDLAAVVTEAGTFNAETGGVRGKVKPLAPYRDLLTDETFAKNVGVSIRGSASDITIGEAEGRTGPIVEGLEHITSVDFVTRAGRGGRVLQVLESERAVRRALAHGVSEATVNDTREALQNALGQAYGDDDSWVYVRDFDESTVWFQVSQDGVERMYGQSYTQGDGGAVTLTGERTEVRSVTTYVPVTRPDSTTTTTESEEDTMPKIQIEESEHTRLTETAGRVDVLESERNTALAERDQARQELARRDRTDKARTLIATEASKESVTFTALEERGLLADLPVTEDGTLDEAAFTTAVTTAVAEAKAARGEGTVSGFGGTPTGGTQSLTEADIDRAVADAFGHAPQVQEA